MFFSIQLVLRAVGLDDPNCGFLLSLHHFDFTYYRSYFIFTAYLSVSHMLKLLL